MTGVPGIPAGLGQRQRGVVLFVSLLLLLILTLIGLAAVRNTTQDERLAADQRDQDLAFQAAEAALRDGESMLRHASPGEFNNTGGYYDSRAAITWQSADWTDTGSDPTLKTLAYEGTLNPALARPPRFYIVKTAQTVAAPERNPAAGDDVDPAIVYEIIAKGWGATAKNSVVIESTFEVSDPGSGNRLSWQQLQ